MLDSVILFGLFFLHTSFLLLAGPRNVLSSLAWCLGLQTEQRPIHENWKLCKGLLGISAKPLFLPAISQVYMRSLLHVPAAHMPTYTHEVMELVNTQAQVGGMIPALASRV